ncbi:hypothetical protein [Cupriavidus taiwanensis]|nr:hypothetical protein [Cupriavidus taiwanensis]
MNDYHIRICQRLPNPGAKLEAVVELGRQRRQVLAELALLLWHPWLGGYPSLERAERLCGDRCQALYDARFGKDDRGSTPCARVIGSPLAFRFQRPARLSLHRIEAGMHDPDAPPLAQLSVRCVTICSLAKELPGKMASNPELRDVYIAVSCSGRPATTRAPSLVSAGFFFANRQTARRWIADNGNLADTESGRRRNGVGRFLHGRPAALLHRIESCFFLSRYYLASGPSNLPAAAAACTIGRRSCRRLAGPRAPSRVACESQRPIEPVSS